MFSPYHKFNNSTKLRRTLECMAKSHSIREDIYKSHKKYHYSLNHKLISAKYYIESLKDAYATFNMTAGVQSSGTSSKREDTSNVPVLSETEIINRLNIYLDGFFYSGGSALDILARELLTYFDIEAPANVYYKTAREEITKKDPNDPIIDLLNDPGWKNEFINYRNAATHELLILDNIIKQSCMDSGLLKTKLISIPLPDDPRLSQDERTYKKHKDVSKYSEKTFKRLLELIGKIYGHLVRRIEKKGSLPL